MNVLHAPLRTFCILATMILPPALHANPKGAVVKAGSASFESGPNSLTIRQSSDRGIIHWEDFSVGKGEGTKFIQPSANSATLNRVVGGVPSSIHGTLDANGKVYLINPNGILVGPTGRINTATFVASTLDVPDAEFLAGSNMHFKGNTTAGVVNLGTITATNGDVVLLGHTVQNAGAINAPNGVVALGAGDDIVLQVAGDERIVVNSGVATGGTGVTNSGAIQAAQAELKAAGGNVYALAVNNSGVVRATGIIQRNGRVILGAAGGVVQNTGRIAAKNANGSGGQVRMASGKGGHTIQNGVIDAAGESGQNGGTIELLGETVNVGASSLMDVGGANAGLIAVGVDAETARLSSADLGVDTVIEQKKAADPSAVATSRQTMVEAGSRILANSTGAGQGGHVVVWSDEQSVIGGTIEARGGDLGGDGGFIETSGHRGLSIATGTKILASAAMGKAGTWLMDPAGISIDAGPTDASARTYASPPETDYNQNALVNHVAASDIVAALSSGANVVVFTSNSYANRDIVVASNISTGVLALNSTTHLAPVLTLRSAGGIDINANIGGAGTNLVFSALAFGGNVNVAATASVITSGLSIVSNGTLTIAGLLSSINDRTLTINSGGNILFTGTGQATTTANASMFIDTSNSATATITDAGTTSIITGGLGINAGAKGVGTSANPLHLAVSHFDATVNDNGLTTGTGGGVFVSNSGGNLHIAGSDPHNFSATDYTGVSVPNLPGFGGIEIENTGGDILVDAAFVDRLTAYGNIKLTSASSSDIRITTVDADTVRSYHGSVTLDAGANVIIGDGTNAGVNVRGATELAVNAGGNLVVSGSILKAGGGAGVDIITGGDITVQQASGSDGRIGSSGGVEIDLTTGAGHQVVDNGGSTGGISAQLADDITGNVTTDGAPIFIKTDSLTLGSQLNAGLHGSINITPVSPHWAINLGTSAKNVANELGLSSAELGQITAGNVDLFTGSTNDGLIHVTGAIHLPNAALTQLVLESGGGGGIVIAQTLDVDVNNLVLTAANGGAVTGAGNISADDIIVNVPGAGVNLTGVINTVSLTFHTQSTAKFTNTANQIDKIEASSTGSQGFSIATVGEISIDGALTSTGQALIATGSHLDIKTGASITAPSIILDISHGNLANLSGPNALNGNYIVYLNQLGSSELGGLTGTSYTSAPVVPYDNPLSPAPQVFYFRNLTAPVPTPTTTSAPPVTIAAPRLFSSVPALTPEQTLKDFRKFLFSLSLEDLVKLTADKSVMVDPIKRNELLSQVNVLNQFALKPLSQAAQDALVAQAAREIQAKAASILTQKAAVLTSILYPTVLNLNDPATRAAFDGNGLLASIANINLSSFTIAQLGQLTRAQVLAMLGSAGVKLDSADVKVALNATMTPAQFGSLVKAGDGISVTQFAGLVASGAGNLTVNQIVASGAGNLISQDGGGLISQDGGGFSVVDRKGKLISQDGGSLTVFGLAKLISQDGGGIVSHDAGGIVSHDAGGIVSHDAGGIVSHDAGGIVSHDAGGIVSHDAGGIVSHDAGGLISQDGGGLLQAVASLISQDGGGLLSGRNALISQDGGGLLQGSVGFSSALMNLR